MILSVCADAGFLNNSKSWSRAGAHIFLSKNKPKPKFNGPVLTIAHIITSVMASAAKEELSAIYITAKKYGPAKKTLIEVGWPQPKSPIQTYNLEVVGFTN